MRRLEPFFEELQRMKANEPIAVSSRGNQIAAQAGANASEGLVVEPRRESVKKGLGRCKAKFEIRHRLREHREVGLRNQSQVASNGMSAASRGEDCSEAGSVVPLNDPTERTANIADAP